MNESDLLAGMSLVIIVTLAVGIWLAILAIGIVCLRKYVTYTVDLLSHFIALYNKKTLTVQNTASVNVG